jgi:peptidyl-prolyl cis-trans isomerase C
MTIASARHILVPTEEKCLELKTRIEAGEDFAALAAEFSKCPSGKQGGELGQFKPGQMVPEFDTVVFNEEVGVVHGPVKTQFGYHLLEILSREKEITASARHILVDAEEKCIELKSRIEGGEEFATIAAEFSKCPSGKQGGNLGEFTQGQMVPEFDKVVFNDEVGVVHGPVKTQFGYHLLEILSRTE